MKLRKTSMLIMLCICFCLTLNRKNYTFAQNIKINEKEKPSECEYVSHSLDYSLIDAEQYQNSSFIFIFYLGKEETSKKLTERRMKKLQERLKYKTSDSSQFVIAEGKKRKGLGKLEIYIKGNLEWELFYKKNAANCVE